MSPGDPLSSETGEEGISRITPEQRAEIRALYHLDEPVLLRFAHWLRDVARGDLGRSFHDRRPVSEKITERLPVTLSLNLASILLMLSLSVPLGASAARRPGSWLDRATGAGTYALYAIPVFWAALLLQIAFSVRLRWLPLHGLASPDADGFGMPARFLDGAMHLLLPAVCLAYPGIAYVSRFVRGTLVDSRLAEAGRAARARGLSERSVLFRHGFRQAAVPLLTLAGFLLPGLLGGSVIVETIFAIPGLGRLFVEAMFERDVPVIMGLTLLSGTATLAGIVFADLAYAAADPRVRRV
jgi:peptide/nickel transport system permease protein